jgi:4-amino-4-deoxy-L-arabinose transferase-like glycosyltransferase
MKNKEIMWGLIAILVLALFLRLFLLNHNPIVETDSPAYITIGINLLSGKGYTDNEGNINTVLPPLYPISIGILNKIIPNPELAGKLVSIIFGVLLVFSVYFLTKLFYNQKTALIAAIITSIYPTLTYISTIAYTDPLYYFLLITGIIFSYIALTKNKTLLYTIPAVILALATLTRPEGIAAIAIIPLLILIYHIKKHKLKTILNILLFVIIFLVVLSPYAIFLYKQTGELSFSGKASPNLFYNPESPTYEQDLYSLREDKKGLVYDPYGEMEEKTIQQKITQKGFIINYFKNIIKENKIINIIFPLPFIIIALIGLFKQKRNEKIIKKELIIMAFLAYHLLLYPVFYISIRHLIIITPLLIPWLSKGTIELNKKWKFKYLIIPFIILFCIAGTIGIIKDPNYGYENNAIEHKQAGLWLKENSQEPIVISRKPFVAFYASGLHIPLPYASYEDTINYAKYKKVDYLVIDERYISKTRPQLTFLLNEENTPTDLELVYKNEEFKNKILLYKLK